MSSKLHYLLSLLFFVYTITRNDAVQGANIPGAQLPGWQFKSPLAQKYLVPSRLPGMNFDIGASYAGLLDVPGAQTKLFFWFMPCMNAASNDLVLWSNGGPGCSSLVGAFQEIGPALLLPGQATATKNKYSWNNAASVLFLEHPAPVGFSEGHVVINNENQIADYTFKFLQAFLRVFGEMGGKNFFIAAESYGGYYASYIAQHIYAQQSQLALRLQGVLLVDAMYANYDLQVNVPAYDFLSKNQDAFKFDSHQMASFAAQDKACGYSTYIKNNLNYPTTRPLPNPRKSDPACHTWVSIMNKTRDDFDVYNILRNPNVPDPLAGKTPYPQRADVRKALNVEGRQPWSECIATPESAKLVFPYRDSSDPPAWEVLPSVIASSKRTVLIHGNLDARLFVDGSKLAIQNMTWQNGQGFQKPVNTPFMVNGKAAGKFNTERGLTFIEVDGSGHMVPRDQPEYALNILQFLLGQRTQLS